MTERRIEMIVKAAPLHDIGKVGIPDQILLKNARLTDDVFAVIKTHSKLGSDAKGEAMRGALNNEQIRPFTDILPIGHDALDSSGPKAENNPLAFIAIAKVIALRHHEKWD